MSSPITTRWSDEYTSDELAMIELEQRRLDEEADRLYEQIRELEIQAERVQQWQMRNDAMAQDIVRDIEINESVLLVPRVSTGWSFNKEDGYTGEGDPVRIDVHTDIEKSEALQVGKPFRTWPAAPGIGYREYRITKIDAEGAWGILVIDTVREMTPEETR